MYYIVIYSAVSICEKVYVRTVIAKGHFLLKKPVLGEYFHFEAII